MNYGLILSRGKKSVDLYSDEGMRIVSVTGIGRQADIVTMAVSDFDGELYYNTAEKARNIVITVRYIGAESTHEASKMRLTDICDGKHEVMLRYISPLRDVYITGRVEKCDTPPNTHPMKTQISLLCSDPYFKEYGGNVYTMAGTEPCFEFPVDISEGGIEFAQLYESRIVRIENKGEADTGAIWTLTAKTQCTNPKIENADTGEYMTVPVKMETGDILIFNTNRGEKSITFYRNGIATDLFNSRDPLMTFLQVKTGVNYFKYSFETGDERACDITVQFDRKYGGI